MKINNFLIIISLLLSWTMSVHARDIPGIPDGERQSFSLQPPSSIQIQVNSSPRSATQTGPSPRDMAAQSSTPSPHSAFARPNPSPRPYPSRSPQGNPTGGPSHARSLTEVNMHSPTGGTGGVTEKWAAARLASIEEDQKLGEKGHTLHHHAKSMPAMALSPILVSSMPADKAAKQLWERGGLSKADQNDHFVTCMIYMHGKPADQCADKCVYYGGVGVSLGMLTVPASMGTVFLHKAHLSLSSDILGEFL